MTTNEAAHRGTLRPAATESINAGRDGPQRPIDGAGDGPVSPQSPPALQRQPPG